MVAAGSHNHAHGAAGHTTRRGAAHSHASEPAARERPATPTRSCRPSRTTRRSRSTSAASPGVTPEQQARAENLIAITLVRLPKYADYHVAERGRLRSIGDAVTGDEHFVNSRYFDDGHILDPDYPESLVYKPQPDGTKTLAAAMYMLPPGTKLDRRSPTSAARSRSGTSTTTCASRPTRRSPASPTPTARARRRW